MPGKYITNEEEFLEQYPQAASVAEKHLAGQWKPNIHCNDSVRRNQDCLFRSGKLAELTFTSAAVHDADVFLVHLLVESSTRVVDVRMLKVGGELKAETTIDTGKHTPDQT